MTYKPISMLLVWVFILGLSCANYSCDGSGNNQSSNDTVVVGALLATTGSLSSLGQSSSAALDLAVRDVNDYLAKNGAGFTIALKKADTQANTDMALNQMMSLYESGVKVSVGPQTTEEVHKVLGWANSNGFIVFSDASTAPSLATGGDNILRMTLDDTHQAKAIVVKMQEDDIKVIVPLWLDNSYSNELVAMVAEEFAAKKGVMAAGIKYESKTKDFSSVASALKNQVADAINQYGASSVAVYMVSFEEFNDIFRLADGDPVLSSVKWYGSDACAKDMAIINNNVSARFAYTVSLRCPSFTAAGVSAEDTSKSVAALTGITPSDYGLAAYDALWIIAKAYQQAGVKASTEELNAAIIWASNHYYGATGITDLNSAGDRAFAYYSFWEVDKDDSGYFWTTTSGVVK